MDIEDKIQKNHSLKDLTTFKIGGSVEYFIEIKTIEELYGTLLWAQEKKLPIFILAGGSNVLINDKDFNGIVIKLANNEVAIKGNRIECGAGASLPGLIRQATGAKLTGLEWAVGIPGSTGGAVRGNAGAFGQSISETIETVEVYDTYSMLNKTKIFSRNDCKFKYRGSIFKEQEGLLIWKTDLRLRTGNPIEIRKQIEKNLNYRDQNQPKLPSAGCVFKNLTFLQVKEANPQIAQLAEREGVVKGGMIGAGWLIDKLGIQGKKIGDAKISLEHCNFIVNCGNATAEDVIMLVSLIKNKIRNNFGIQLQKEIQILGFD